MLRKSAEVLPNPKPLSQHRQSPKPLARAMLGEISEERPQNEQSAQGFENWPHF
jgi:hypothetical protein